jgi:hypothetical protein
MPVVLLTFHRWWGTALYHIEKSTLINGNWLAQMVCFVIVSLLLNTLLSKVASTLKHNHHANDRSILVITPILIAFLLPWILTPLWAPCLRCFTSVHCVSILLLPYHTLIYLLLKFTLVIQAILLHQDLYFPSSDPMLLWQCFTKLSSPFQELWLWLTVWQCCLLIIALIINADTFNWQHIAPSETCH